MKRNTTTNLYTYTHSYEKRPVCVLKTCWNIIPHNTGFIQYYMAQSIWNLQLQNTALCNLWYDTIEFFCSLSLKCKTLNKMDNNLTFR